MCFPKPIKFDREIICSCGKPFTFRKVSLHRKEDLERERYYSYSCQPCEVSCPSYDYFKESLLTEEQIASAKPPIFSDSYMIEKWSKE